MRYISNILVVSDPGNPDNEGKVFLYRYGPKLFDKFQAAMAGDEDTAGFNPWDFWEGANFRLRVKTLADKKSNAKFPNYDDSKFAPRSALSEDENELKTIWEKEYSLLAEIGPDKFKSYDELQKQLNKVLALADKPVKEEVATRNTAESRPLEVKTSKQEKEEVTPPWEEPGEADSVLAKFQELANL
jgi:hypothetical protein